MPRARKSETQATAPKRRRNNVAEQESEYSEADDSSDPESGGEDVFYEDSENDSDTDFQTTSYRKASASYTATQKKLEEDYVYQWVEGEKIYEDDLCDKLLLSSRQKEDILKKSKVELFELFFSPEIKDYIVEATKERGYPLTTTDLDVFVGIVVFSSYNERPEQVDYWSKDPLLEAQPVKKAMSRDKFQKIKSNLRYCLQIDKDPNDKVWKLRPILKIFQKNIMQYGVFSTALSIDEMMVKFFGRLSFKQFIMAKPIRFGIKWWALCGSNGYIYFFDIYCGKNSKQGELSNIAQGSYVVLKLLKHLLAVTSSVKLSEYHLYIDNLFCSPDLLVHLKKLNLRVTGVVRADRIKEKNEIDKKAPKGTYVAKHDKASGMNYITARDSKNVSILSTAAGVTPMTPMNRYIKENKEKAPIPFPNVFSKYNKHNKFMGGVDLHDQHCNNLLPCIRSKKWPWVIFIRMIQSAMTNAYIMYNLVRDDRRKIGAKQVALEISREYLSRSVKPLVQRHSIIDLKTTIKCSGEKCGKRCQKQCKTCEKTFCKSCLVEAKICLQRDTIIDNRDEVRHRTITADKRGYCTSCNILPKF